MTVWGETAGGGRVLLGTPSRAEWAYDRDAPAQGFAARFPVEQVPEALYRVEIRDGDAAVFRGIVDEQNTRLSAQGLELELIGRSLEGLLLDSEAPPGVVEDPSLALWERRLLEPLGLRLGEEGPAGRGGLWTVSKGQSCWTVLADFCRQRLGAVPRVDPEGRVWCRALPEEQLRLGPPVTWELQLQPCRRLSQVWQQSFRGQYDTRYRDPEAVLPRVRYLAADSGKDPRQVLRSGREAAFRLEVTVPGACWPHPGTRVTAELPGVGRFARCPVESARVRRDAGGEQTRLVLTPPETFCA